MNGWKKKIWYNIYKMIYYKIIYTNQKGGNIDTILGNLETNLNQKNSIDLEIQIITELLQEMTPEQVLDINTKVKEIMVRIWGKDFFEGIIVKEDDIYNTKMFLLLKEIDKRYQILQQQSRESMGKSIAISESVEKEYVSKFGSNTEEYDKDEYDDGDDGVMQLEAPSDILDINSGESISDAAQDQLVQLWEGTPGEKPTFDQVFDQLNIHNIQQIYTDSPMLQATTSLETIKQVVALYDRVRQITFTLQNASEITYHNSLIFDSKRFIYNPNSNSKKTPINLWGILSRDDDKLIESAGATITIELYPLYLKSPNLELEDVVDPTIKFSLDFLRHKIVYGFRLYKTILNHIKFLEGIEALRLFSLDIQMILNLHERYIATNNFHQDGTGAWNIWSSLVSVGMIEKNMSKLILIYTSNFSENTKGMGLVVAKNSNPDKSSRLKNPTNAREIDLEISEGTFKVIIIDGNDDDILHATFTNSEGYFGFRELYRIHTGFLLTKEAKDFLIENGSGEHKYLTPDILKFFLSEDQLGAINKPLYDKIQTQIAKSSLNYGGLN